MNTDIGQKRAMNFPPGWSISKNDDGTVGVVCHSANSPGGDIAIRNAGRLEQRLLHALACAIVDAAAPANPCRCIDCGGDELAHSDDCTNMAELHGTPAAPGIDLAELAELLRIWQCNFDSGVRPDEEVEPEDAALWDRIDRIRQQADASPKGGSDLIACVERIEEAIEHRVPHDIYGTVHVELAEIRRLAHASSPKGGSEALDAARLDWLDANGFTAYRQVDPIDGLSGHCVVVHETMTPRRGNVHDTIRGAIDAAMQAQAGDAEVQP